MTSGTWLGIDFSGDVKQWGAGRRKSNIWVAEVRAGPGLHLHLADLRRVQDLLGDVPPFERMATLLRRGAFSAAGIDAPFSIPSLFVQDHPALMRRVGQLKLPQRAFASGSQFVEAVARQAPPLSPPKPLRTTEKEWNREGVNVRSTLWAGPRGGAPMTAACLTLLGMVGGPVWPFTRTGVSLLVEAFPAAQLRAWRLPHQGYGHAAEGADTRKLILSSLKTRLHLGSFEHQMQQSADALDAVLAAFAAIAVTEAQLLAEPGPDSDKEGWIAVHREIPE